MPAAVSKAFVPFLALVPLWILTLCGAFPAVAADRSRRESPVSALRGGFSRLSESPSAFISLARLVPGWWKPVTTTPGLPYYQRGRWGKFSTNFSGGATAFGVPIETCTTVLNMPGTFAATESYWKTECKSVSSKATFIKITIGNVTDYFRPGGTNTICDMLTSNDKHLWSPNLYVWSQPQYSKSALGGSAAGFPAKVNPKDKRSTLTFWGSLSSTAEAGGCCNTDYQPAGMSWGKPYKLAYCGTPRVLAPICTPLVTVASTQKADKAYWAQLCKQVPMTASFVKVAIDGFVDYFKPGTGKTYCDMLTAGDLHKWSKDGYSWIKPDTLTSAATHLGGSSFDAMKGYNGRVMVSSWGTQGTDQGGYSATSSGQFGWGRAFTMSWCEVPRVPPMAQLVSEMRQTTQSVQNLETKLDGLHRRLLRAEKVSVFASGNVSLAREGVYRLAKRFIDEEDKMKKVQMMASLANTSLNSMRVTLHGAEKRVRKAATLAHNAADVANKTSSQKALLAHERLNKKIWALTNPSNPDRLAVIEKNITELEQGIDKFRGQLGDQIKKVMMTKLRRTVRTLRDAILRLGTASVKRSSQRLGDVEGSESLGADIGINYDED